MKILNLGCGSKTSDRCINLDWSVYLRIKRNPVLRAVVSRCVSAQRRQRLQDLSSNVVVHDMRCGLPFDDNSVDAVYHSHVLEHIDRAIAPKFQYEIHRVLKPGGIQRICLPDLELLVRNYLDSLQRCEADPAHRRHHDSYVHAILEQSVRKESFGSSQQPPWRRFLENRLMGDARQRGETHQWMYDRFNLQDLLSSVGFPDIRVRSWNDSAIEGWDATGLEVDESGAEYMPGSLYMEARKQASVTTGGPSPANARY